MNNRDMILGMLLAGNDGGGASETYQLLSYIQSNGTQAILLKDAVSPTAKIEVLFEYIADMDFKWIVGGEGASGKFFGVQVNGGSVDRISCFRSTETRFSGLNSYKNRPIYATINGASASVSYSSSDGTVGSSFDVLSGLYAFGIGRINYEAEASSMISAKLHLIRVDNELFLPVKRISDGVLGLLNTATHEFLTDSLNGDPLVAGDVIGTI